MNGSLGSSSFWGFFIENGPYCFKENQDGKFELKPNPHSWSRHANYLIFEYPSGVTLSFCEDTNTLPQNVCTGELLYQALQHFVGKHPEMADNPIILAEKSYAGTYCQWPSKLTHLWPIKMTHPLVGA